MLAAQFSQPGGAEVIAVVEMPTPRVGAGQVLVKAWASGVGMPDVLIRSGRYPWMPPLPAILGIEMSGVVAEVAPDVKDVQPGQRVFVSARDLPVRAGCYAEYIAVDSRAVKVLPDEVDLDEAACLSNYQVAYHLVHTAARGVEARSVLVYGAAGGVGSAAVQLAKAAGLRVIAVVGSKEKAAFARAQGADDCIDHREADLGDAVRELTQGEGVDLVLDPVGGAATARNFDWLAPLGMVVSYGALEGLPAADLLTPMRANWNASPAFRLFTMHTFDRQPQVREATMRELLRLLAARTIRPPIFARLPLAQARQAHELFEGGSVLGKLLLKPPASAAN
jgi:NADPH2:quinone reductase